MTKIVELIPDIKNWENVTAGVDWEIEFLFNNERFLVTWEHFTQSKTGNTDHYLVSYQDNKDKWLKVDKTSALAAAAAWRSQEIRKKYYEQLHGIEVMIGGTKQSLEQRFDDVIYDLFKRSEAGEYVGQSSSFIYIQDAARILDEPYKQVFVSVHRLIESKKLGLTGNILISWEQYDANQKYWLRKTGHKGFDSSDMGGNWWCTICGAKGEWVDGDDPKKVPCI